jgi:hypothetical protein
MSDAESTCDSKEQSANYSHKESILYGINMPVFGAAPQSSGDSCYKQHRLCEDLSETRRESEHKGILPGTLLFVLSGVLHPRQVDCFTANFISPPTVGVAI